MADHQIPRFDPTDFTVDSYTRKIDKPWGYELHLVPDSSPYMLKIIHIDEGARLSLQIHDQKVESWLLIKGRASVTWKDNQDNIVVTELRKNVGYTTELGQMHRLVGLTDCDIVEASTPEVGTTWRVEDDYSRPDETPEQRKIERHQD